MILNDGTRYSNIVKAVHPQAECGRLWISSCKKMFYVMVPTGNSRSSIIGRGLTSWLAWKNASWYIEREMLKKLES